MSERCNILTKKGDKFTTRLEFPVTNILRLTDVVDNLTTAEQTKVGREFSYSLDLVRYTEHRTLTPEAVRDITITPKQDLDMEFIYTLEEDLPEGEEIRVEFISLAASYDTPTNIFTDTVFSILDDSDYKVFRRWCAAVFRKVYERGIVPVYVERGNSNLDRDYLDFWRSVVCFWGILVTYSRRFESLEKLDILRRILDSRGIYYPEDGLVEDLVEIVYTSWYLLEQRGVSLEESKDLVNYEQDYGGELFIVSESIPGTSGIWLDRNSGIERYIQDQLELSTLNVHSPDTYFIECTVDKEQNTVILDTAFSYIETRLMKINPLLDYELVFLVSSEEPRDMSGDIRVFNAAEEEIPWTEIPVVDLVGICTNPDTKYLYRLVLYGTDSVFSSEDSLNTTSGRNGKLPSDASFVLVRLATSGSVTLNNLDFKILKTDYEKSAIQGMTILDGFFRDKAEDIDYDTIMNNKMVNFDRTFLTNRIL